MNSRPDVFLISIDCLRPDHVGAFNRMSRLTPTLDRIIERGTIFTNAVSHVPFTTPAVAAMLTGRYPYQTGVRLLLGQICNPETTTIAQAAKRAGYVTAGYPSTFILNSNTGLSRGFDEYRDITDGHHSGRGGCWQTGAPLNEAFDRFLSSAGGDPVFSWIHYFDLHEYHTDTTAPPQTTYARDLHEKIDADCFHNFLAILEKHDRMRNAAFIITADHGECLFQHGVRGHGQHLYDSVLRVPLSIYWPGSDFAKTQIVRQQARHIDLLPTLIELWGIDGEYELPGRRLFSNAPCVSPTTSFSYAEASPKQLFEGNTAEFKAFAGPEMQSLRNDRLKFIRHDDGRTELYDLTIDPNEYDNTSQKNDPRIANAIDSLTQQMDELTTDSTHFENRRTITAIEEAAVRQRLQQLGYVSEHTALSSQST